MTELRSSGLGEKIRRIRYQRGWSQTDLSERSGISRSWINQIETGAVGVRRHQARTIFRLAEALDLAPEDLQL